MAGLRCAFTGHRPQRFMFGAEDDARCTALKGVIRAQILSLIAQGYEVFYTGMALGTDTWCAEAVLSLKAAHPNIRLIAVVPCQTQADAWPAKQRQRYFNILMRCDGMKAISRLYTPTCMLERNRYLVDNADIVLAVYDGKPRGGTAHAVRYAKARPLPVIIIDPDSLDIVHNAC